MNIPKDPVMLVSFLNLKLRERAEQEAHVKVAVVECNPENLSQMSEQLRHLAGVDLYSYMLHDIRQYPYKLSEDFDLIVTTSSHAEYLLSVLPVPASPRRCCRRRLARSISTVPARQAWSAASLMPSSGGSSTTGSRSKHSRACRAAIPASPIPLGCGTALSASMQTLWTVIQSRRSSPASRTTNRKPTTCRRSCLSC